MCVGNSQQAAENKRYERELGEWKADWNNKKNSWAMRLDQYKIDKSENANAYSRQVGSIQRNFGMEIDSFLVNNMETYKQFASKTPNPLLNQSRTAGRASKLAQLSAENVGKMNLRMKGIQADEGMAGAQRQLLSAQSKALGRRGFLQMAKAKPIKPTAPSGFDQVLGLATTASSFINPLQTIGRAANWGQQDPTSFWGKFFA